MATASMEAYLRPALKTSLLLLSAVSVHLSLSPPNPPVKQEELYWRSTMVWVGVLTEILVPTIASAWSRHWASALFDASASYSGCECHPLLIAGALFTILAASLRIWCFKKLGPLFTFEITIRPKHELITSGPYSFVRHPSYTGVFLTLIGASLLLFAPSNWVATKGVWTVPGALFGLFWAVKCAFAFRGTYLRLTTEDEVLRETFGVEWEEYARRVPWRLLPGVF
ncbi:hypothetical protein CC1G_06457 [Coprinopsis cinerea okayama7|uniref:Protein-S-isoprenylcysteine O-methyltransferase n=1 Tax=Coprinopsis cinerea (strain Okayama-7 / 130 / ATCC MYA-4618 / FGSC 9003) TaxID=240176 RepID=A8NN62_COPC7|nr:hypothetical protein CC1G_06457 [Coprinopsis cinerea okayama7\|eukprot:XP_001835054.2 hypothetical protein CC1G_06457 [Coprinopsis cinerea okayama7\